jgi:hypothetical protein
VVWLTRKTLLFPVFAGLVCELQPLVKTPTGAIKNCSDEHQLKNFDGVPGNGVRGPVPIHCLKSVQIISPLPVRSGGPSELLLHWLVADEILLQFGFGATNGCSIIK